MQYIRNQIRKAWKYKNLRFASTLLDSCFCHSCQRKCPARMLPSCAQSNIHLISKQFGFLQDGKQHHLAVESTYIVTSEQLQSRSKGIDLEIIYIKSMQKGQCSLPTTNPLKMQSFYCKQSPIAHAPYPLLKPQVHYNSQHISSRDILT